MIGVVLFILLAVVIVAIVGYLMSRPDPQIERGKREYDAWLQAKSHDAPTNTTRKDQQHD